MGTRVPAEPIARAIQGWLDEHPHISLEDFGEQVGLTKQRLCNAFSGCLKTFEFSVADTILCRINRPQLWTSPELADVYYAVDLTEYEPWELELLEAERLAA